MTTDIVLTGTGVPLPRPGRGGPVLVGHGDIARSSTRWIQQQRPFAVSPSPTVVSTSTDGAVRVPAVAVHHEPVPFRPRPAPGAGYAGRVTVGEDLTAVTI